MCECKKNDKYQVCTKDDIEHDIEGDIWGRHWG